MGAPAGDRWLHKRQVNEVRNISISTTSNNIDFAGSTSKADSTARKVTREAVIEKLLMISAGISILSIILITVFIFARGIPLVTQVGLSNFLFNLTWNPANKIYGIGAMFIGSLGVTLVALSWAVPLGLAAALFIAEIAPSAVGSLLSRFVELLAGIPSVVYGFWANRSGTLHPGDVRRQWIECVGRRYNPGHYGYTHYYKYIQRFDNGGSHGL